MNLYDRVLSKRARWVAPMLAPLGASLTGADPQAVRGARQVQMRALQALQERFSPDIVFPLMDLSVEVEVAREVMSADFLNSGIPPQEVIRWLEKLDDVVDIDPEEYPAMLFQLDLASEMKDGFTAPVAAYASGPFHLASQLFGTDEMLLWALSDEDCSVGIMEFITRLLGSYVGALAERADLVMLVEPELPLLSPAFFGKVCHLFFQGIASIIRSAGASPALHLRGDSRHMLEHLISLGMECVSFDSQVDLRLAAETLPLNLIILGNLDTRRLELSSPADVGDKVRRLLRDMSGYRNFVLSTGCEVSPSTPLENVEAFFEAGRG
jgi:uroporphyrinogen decarboxylase